MKTPPPDLAVEIRPSRLLGGFILSSHAAAVVPVAALGQRHGAFLLLLVAVLLSALAAWRRHMSGTVRLVLEGEGGCLLLPNDGTARPARLLGHSRVWPHLMVLNLRLDEGGRRCLVLLPDNCDAEQRRRLRVRLLNAPP